MAWLGTGSEEELDNNGIFTSAYMPGFKACSLLLMPISIASQQLSPNKKKQASLSYMQFRRQSRNKKAEFISG